MDSGVTEGKVIIVSTGDKLPAVDGSNLTGIWSLISSATGSSSSSSGVPTAATVAIPTGTKYIIVQLNAQRDEGSTNLYYTAGQIIVMPSVITSGYIRSAYSTSDEAYIHLTATITGTNVVITSNIAGGGGATASFSGVCYFFK